jgi:uncharacterized membrane protein
MPTSIFLAKLIGPVFLAVGIGVLINAAVYRKLADEFLRSYALVYVSGLLLMTAGMAVILTHNVWAADWRVVITLLGWLAAIGGALRIVMPERVETMGHWFLERPTGITVAAVIWLAIGALLTFFGYFH